MDLTNRLAISYYKTIATINTEHKIYLVMHQDSHKIYIKKVLDIYNLQVFRYLKEHNITGIPAIFELFEEDGQLIIIEEYISGTPLQELMDSNSLTIENIKRFILELCDILGQLHDANPAIIHRDIKPSNIIITPYQHVMLLDYNAAKFLNSEESEDTVLLGTVGYAAPEQYGFGSSTPQTDIYSLGVLLKEMLASSTVHTKEFDSIVTTCTQMNPEDRFSSVYQLKGQISHSDFLILQSKEDTCSSWILPGFRTRTPWKMITAASAYLLLILFSLNLKVPNATTSQTWIERGACFMTFFSFILCTTNYRNCQRLIPLCSSRAPYIRYAGIFMLNIVIMILILTIMTILIFIFR